MALRKLNETPSYSMVVPSTGKHVKFRPYLVKEEKVLMMAFESGNLSHALSSIVDTIDACLVDKIETDKLTTFDVEYMFTQLRAKSVGENSTVSIKCKEAECRHPNEVVIDLEKIEIPNLGNKQRIQLTEDVELDMVYPSYLSLAKENLEQLGENFEAGFNMIANCINAVQYENERVSLADETPESIREFLESLTSSQFRMITDFVNEMPRMKHAVTFNCQSCKTENEITLEGMADFF